MSRAFEPSSDVQRIRIRTHCSLSRGATKGHRPKSRIDDRFTISIGQTAQPVAGCGIVSIDLAVAEISYEDISPELAKARRSHSNTPRRTEVSMLREMPEQIAVSIEHTDEAMRWLVHWVMLRLVLQRVCNPEIASDILNAEWCVSMLHFRVGERPTQGRRVEVTVEDVDFASPKIRSVQERLASRVSHSAESHRQALVYSAAG